MSGVSLVFVIGLFNLFLGYALAVRLGYGPTILDEACHAVATEEPNDSPINQPDDSVEVPLDDLIHELISGSDDPHDCSWDDEPDDETPDPAAGETEPAQQPKCIDGR